MDPEHYFDWAITALSSSDQDDLPAWLLVMEAHLNETKRFRFRCRRLIEALLDQLETVRVHYSPPLAHLHFSIDTDFCSQITTPDMKETSVSLQRSVVAFIRSLVFTDPMCCILPRCWLKYQAVLKLCFNEEDPRLDHYFQILQERNLRLCRPGCVEVVGSYQIPRQRFIALLDSLGPDFDIDTLSNYAFYIANDPNVLISTLIEWATTWYRAGVSRIYIALRLFRQWSKAGLSLDQPVLHFISHFSNTPGLHRPSIYKLFAELIRSKLLAVDKYLHWLIARGPLVDPSEAKTVSSFTSFLCISADDCRLRCSNWSCSITFPCMAYRRTYSIYAKS